MLKYIALMTMGVFGAASMAVAGAPITTITTTMPRLRRLERPVVHAKKPNLIPKVPRVGTNMRVRDQQSGTQPRIRGLPGHRGRTSSGRRLMVPQHIVPIVKEARLPDLVIRSAVIRPAKVCRSGAPVLYVTARVVNIGRGASTAKPSVGMVQARNTGGVNWGNGHGLPALAPGASASVRFPVYYLQSNPGYMRGTHTFKLTVNAGKWLHESNYANNGFRPVRVTLPPGLCGAKADITSRKGPTIGGKYVPWGGAVTLGRKDAKRVGNHGKCVFDVYYDMTNQGKAATRPAFVNRLREDRTLAAINSNLNLKAGETRTIRTEPTLLSGAHTFSLSLDDGNAVRESNESNNVFRVRVDVDNSCKNNPSNIGALPDLKIVRVTPRINSRVAGMCRTGRKGRPDSSVEVLNFDLVVKNVGRGTAYMDRYGVILSAQTTDFHERVFDTSKLYQGGTGGPGHFQGPHGYQAWRLVRMGPIAPGASFTAHSHLGIGYNNTRFTIARMHELAGQTHRFRIKLTSYGSPGLKESNTRNNEYIVSYTFPRNFCTTTLQHGFRVRPPSQMPPRLMPPSPRMKLTPRMRLNRSSAGAADRNRIPGLLSPSAVHVQKKLTPSLQKKLSLSAARPK